METSEKLYRTQDDVIHMSPGHERTKRALVEVFSVQISAESVDELEHIGGIILLKGSEQNYVLYENPCDGRGPQFNSEGYLTLIGPDCGVEVKEDLVMYPWLFHKISDLCDRSKGKKLWKRDPCSPRTNQLIRKGFRSKVGMMLMKVEFAVYSDGVEACIEITLADLRLGEWLLPSEKSLEIYGTVKASNSVINQSKARSTMLDKHFSWPLGEGEISVPLTRSVTVIPRESSLIVNVDLSCLCRNQGEHVAVGSVTFDDTSRSSNIVEEKIIIGALAHVKVKVTWST